MVPDRDASFRHHSYTFSYTLLRLNVVTKYEVDAICSQHGTASLVLIAEEMGTVG